MSTHWFGTDGIRGQVGSSPMTPEFCLRLGAAAGRVLGAGATVLIGKDTRISGYMIESVLEAGLVSSGVNVLLLGPMPTPAIAYLTSAFRADAGIVISASHNPYQDNGIKFFDRQGEKLAHAAERAIEAELKQDAHCVAAETLGKARRVDDASGRYIEYCKATVQRRISLKDVSILVDAAHGSCYQIAPSVFSEMGARVEVIGNTPDGLNINHECGSVHPEVMAQATQSAQAEFGIALDGDGDRVVMADASGRMYDGDAILFMLAAHRDRRHGGPKGGVVCSEMSNLGLARSLERLDVETHRVPVGDRHIKKALRSLGWTLGGEPSGHIMMLDLAPSADGILTALQVLQAAVAEEMSLADLCAGFEPMPSVLRNVRVDSPQGVVTCLREQGAIREAECSLHGKGRLLVRASGTETLVRILVEGEDIQTIGALADKLARLAEEV